MRANLPGVGASPALRGKVDLCTQPESQDFVVDVTSLTAGRVVVVCSTPFTYIFPGFPLARKCTGGCRIC